VTLVTHADCITVTVLNQGCTNFRISRTNLKILRHQIVDTKQVLYSGPADIERHSTIYSGPGSLKPEICWSLCL
jgi:hypothetical protein